MFHLRLMLMSLRSLFIHPLRSALATLGVIIGVAAVVAAMSILEGMKASFTDSFSTIGSNTLFVSPAQQRRGGRSVGNVNTLELADCEAIRRECDMVANATPQINSGGLIKFLSKNTTATILGTDEQYCEDRYGGMYGPGVDPGRARATAATRSASLGGGGGCSVSGGAGGLGLAFGVGLLLIVAARRRRD